MSGIGNNDHSGLRWAMGGVIYQFGCTTPTVVYNPFEGGSPFLYTSNVYCKLPSINAKPETEVKAIAYGSSIDIPPNVDTPEQEWKYQAHPMSAADQMKLNKKGVTHQIQGITEPVFWMFKANKDGVYKNTPYNGIQHTYFINEGRLLYSGLSLLCYVNSSSDIKYDMPGTNLNKGKVKYKVPDSDWYQTSGAITTEKGRYDFTIDASNIVKLYFAPEITTGDPVTNPKYADQGYLINITSDVISVEIPLPEYTVKLDGAFRDYFAEHTNSSGVKRTAPAPRYHWKVRHDGKKIAAIINLREPMLVTPTFKRFGVNADTIGYYSNGTPYYEVPDYFKQFDFGSAFYYLHPDMNSALPSEHLAGEVRQDITQERTAVVVYSLNLEEHDDGTYELTITQDSLSDVNETAMPFSVGFAEPHNWKNGVEAGDLLVASMKLSQDKAMKDMEIWYGTKGVSPEAMRYKKVVEIRNNTKDVSVMSFCTESNNYNSIYAQFGECQYTAALLHLNLKDLSLMSHLNLTLPDKTTVPYPGAYDFFYGTLETDNGSLVYAYGEIVHNSASVRLKTKFDETEQLEFPTSSTRLGNLYSSFLAESQFKEIESTRTYFSTWYTQRDDFFVRFEDEKHLYPIAWANQPEDPLVARQNAHGWMRSNIVSLNGGFVPDPIYPDHDYVVEAITERTSTPFIGSQTISVIFGWNLVSRVATDFAVSYGLQPKYNPVFEDNDTADNILFISSFYIENYPLGNHAYMEAINRAFLKDFNSHLVCMPGDYPSVSYSASPFYYWSTKDKLLACKIQNGCIVRIELSVADVDIETLINGAQERKCVKDTTLDGVVFNFGHPTAEKRVTHLDMYNNAFDKENTKDDFTIQPTYFYNSSYEKEAVGNEGYSYRYMGIITFFEHKLGRFDYRVFVNGSIVNDFYDSKGTTVPVYPMLCTSALFTYQ